MRTVVVLGAHTAVGRAVVECLEERELDVVLRQATLTEHLGPGLDAIDEALLKQGDLFVLAFSGPIARGVAQGLAGMKKPVLDVRGDGEGGGLSLWPGLDPSAGASLDPAAPHRIPVGLASPVVAVLQALRAFQPRFVSVATYESAALFDQPGMDELSAQTRGVFTMNPPEPEVFPASVAFDIIPSAAPRGGDPAAAARALEAAVAEGAAALGLAVTVAATRAVVPSFSADAAVVEVTLGEPPTLEVAREALEAGRTLRVGEDELMPSLDAVGRDDAQVGQLRLVGDRLRLWLTSDRLRRGSATQVALAVERWLAGPDNLS
jgi:aspartate-semialdehyde dehydrogenase